jgi:hypothetical protein
MTDERLLTGWILIAREELPNGEPAGDWSLAWHEIFGRKKSALAFAKENGWPRPYRAVRGHIGSGEMPHD